MSTLSTRPYYVDTASLVETGQANQFVRQALTNLANRRHPAPEPVVPGEIVSDGSDYGDGDGGSGGSGGFGLPPEDTYSAKYNVGLKYYYSYFDEALFDDYQNALSMRRDGQWQEMLDHRRLPTVSRDYEITCDDPDDPEQTRCCGELDLIVKRIPRFLDAKLWLMEHLFFGKSGLQVRYGYKTIRGRKRMTILDHAPVHGDKLIPRYDGGFGVLVYRGDGFTNRQDIEPHLFATDRGTAFHLYNQYWRDRFIIHRFQPSDFDYLFEGNAAAGRFGYGYRGRYYWAWNLRTEALGWIMDALQRVGSNGLNYGVYEWGNAEAKKAMETMIKQLNRNQWSLVPLAGFTNRAEKIPDIIKNIPVSAVGYEVLLRIIEYLDNIMRRGVLGQTLSSQASPTGIGQGATELQADVREDYMRYDTVSLDETLNDQMIERLVRLNTWQYRGQWLRGDQLPFEMRLKSQIDKKEGPEQIEAANKLHAIGVDLDKEDLREQAGLEGPKDQANLLPGQSGQQGQSADAGQQGVGSPGGQPEASQQEAGPADHPDRLDANAIDWSRPPALPREFRHATANHAGTTALAEQFHKDHLDADGRPDPGVLISLAVPGPLAASLALGVPDAEQAEELHVTLFYLGRLSQVGHEAAEAAREVCRLFAKHTPPLDGRIAGLGRFPATKHSDGKDVVYAKVDLPGLKVFREDLAECLRFRGVKWKQNFDFTPHITLAYVPAGARVTSNGLPDGPPIREPEFEYRAVQLQFSVGGDAETFWLNGGQYKFDFYGRDWDESKQPQDKGGKPTRKDEGLLRLRRALMNLAIR